MATNLKAVDWKAYPNFKEAEFKCKHTGLDGMQKEFMDKLQHARRLAGFGFIINSGYRHPTHPVEAAKGHSLGEHTRGLCADIRVDDSRQRFKLIQAAIGVGFTRIGIAKGFVHVGLGGEGLPPEVAWLY